MGEESEYGSGGRVFLSTTKYGVIVSEEKDIVMKIFNMYLEGKAIKL